MKILFVHQNFPGQFGMLAKKLASLKYEVASLSINKPKPIAGVKHYIYKPTRSSSRNIHPWSSDFETKMIRAEGAFIAYGKLKKIGFNPDIVIGHPGWGELLCIKEIWPTVKVIQYCEFFYQTKGQDVNFDPEFIDETPDLNTKVFLKNANNLLSYQNMDVGISPTEWQRNTYPDFIKSKIITLHDGIDTEKFLTPTSEVTIDNKLFKKSQNIVTFFARNLEPYRGYHQFLRSIQYIQSKCPDTIFLIVGASGHGYGIPPQKNDTWKNILWDEVKNSIDATHIYFSDTLPHDTYIKALSVSTVHIYLTYPFVLSWSVIEAMAAGCCIVGSDTAPVKEIIQDGVNGTLVNFFQPKAIADATIKLLQDPNRRNLLSHAAKEYARKNFDFEKNVFPKIHRLLNQLVKS